MPRRFFFALLSLLALAAGPLARASNAADHSDLSIGAMTAILDKMSSQIPANISLLEARQKEYTQSVRKMENRLHELTVAVYFQNFSNFFFVTYYCNQIANLRTEFFSGNFPFAATRQGLEVELRRFERLRDSLASMKRHGDVDDAERAQLDCCMANCKLLQTTYKRFYDTLLSARERYNRLGEAIKALDIYANGREVDLYATFDAAVKTASVAGADATPAPGASNAPSPANAAPATPDAAASPDTAHPAPPTSDRHKTAPMPAFREQEEGALARRISDALWKPNRPFRHTGISSRPLESIAHILMRSVRNNYIDPGDREMVAAMKKLLVQAAGSLAMLLVLAPLAVLFVGRRLAPRKRSYPRLSVSAAAAVCLLEAAWLWGYSGFIEKEYLRADVVIFAQFLLICAVVIFSLAVRLPATRVRQGFHLFAPTMALSGAMLLYDLAKATTFMVAATMPFLYMLAIAAMLLLLMKRSRGLPVGLKTHAVVSLIVAVGGLVVCLKGYSYLMMMAQLAWFVLLAGILALGTLSIKLQEKTQAGRSGKMHRMWLHLFLAQFVVPTLAILCVWFALKWPADAFDLSYMLKSWMHQIHAINGFMNALSIDNALIIVTIGISLNCLVSIVRQTIHSIYGSEFESGRIPTLFTLGTMLAWGGFVMIALHILRADYHGILVVMGGMSVGVGFAMKETIENLISGLSLMLGRMRPGDIVECDGIRGKVASIGYRTTTIETIDGSIIAFQNSQLFNRNFSNMTKNHLYERATVSIGVTYGTDIDYARRLILEAVSPLPVLSRKHAPFVVLDEFGDSAVNLCVSVWVPVRTKPIALSAVREAIYKTFNAHGVEIPFPQQDLYIKAEPSSDTPFQVQGTPGRTREAASS